jgi:integrase/recombinase XerD
MTTSPEIPLDQHLEDYLRLRRALGFKLVFPGQVLPRFVAYLHVAGETTVTLQSALRWAKSTEGQPMTLAHRLGAVRGFARYLVAINPATEVPPHNVLGAHQHRPTPFIWSDDDVRALLDEANQLVPRQQALTFETLLSLIAVTGLRIGEALGLECNNVNLKTGTLLILHSKTQRPRIVPLHPTTTAALLDYQQCCTQWFPLDEPRTFFCSPTGKPLRSNSVHNVFNKLTTAAGLRTEAVRPRIHDLRHSFAVRQLIEWQRAGVDISANIPKLSAYLGHVDPTGTYW